MRRSKSTLVWSPIPDSRFARWQLLTGAALLVGYGGYYICRSNLSVAIPALLADSSVGIDRSAIGLMPTLASLGSHSLCRGRN